jgi:glucose/arabinose dehydrogenase
MLLGAQPGAEAPVQSGGLPAPQWVEMVDQGASDLRLKGIHTPRGIKVELAASERDAALNHSAEFAGWSYHSRGQEVQRRRPHDGDLLKTLKAAAESGKGPPTSGSADGKWIEQVLIRGLDEDGHALHRISLSPDGHVYVACASGNHRAESWDGSKAAVLRSGAVFRMRPDGSRLEEFARGLAHPSAIAFDAFGNALCIDRGVLQTTFKRSRLIHVLPGGNYGWLATAKSPAAAAAGPAAIMPDTPRASPTGERPGLLPPMLQIEQVAFKNPLLCRSAAFPEFLQDVLLVPDGQRGAAAAFVLEREGPTFRVARQFDVVRSEDERFHLETIRHGPDGAVYLLDRQGGEAAAAPTDQPAKLLRLSWAGHGDAPALPLLASDRLNSIQDASAEELCKLLESADPQLRQAAVHQVIAAAGADDSDRASLTAGLTAALKNERLPPGALASVIHAAGPHADKAMRHELCRLIQHENDEIARLAANALGDNPPSDPEELSDIAEHLKGAYGRVSHAAAERAVQLALASLAAAGVADAAEWGFEATSVTHGPKMGRYTFDGHVRALERVPGAAKELLLGNLDVAINLDIVEPLERQRLKEFVTLTAESMRARELAEFLDALLRGEEDLFVKIEAPLEARLIACYQNVLVDPPITADAVIEWLEKHPGGPVEVEIAALETLAHVGTTKKEPFDKLTERLLAEPAAAAALAQRLVSGHLDRSLLPKVRAAMQGHAASEQVERAAKLLAELNKLDRQVP